MTDSILLTGAELSPAAVAAVAAGAGVRLAPEGLERMARCRRLLEAALAEERPIYGVTTGLGSRVTERLDPEARLRMSLNTVRGRAHSVGAPMPAGWVRAAMCVRANTLLLGAAGARPEMAELIAGCLAAGLTPVVRETGSVGAADLMWGGSLGLGLIGEGAMDTPRGARPAAEALAEAGLAPYRPGPREGLALVSHSSFVAGIAAMGVVRARRALESAQTAAAVSLEAFRANLSPLDPRVLALRPQPGQLEAAAGLMLRLDGSELSRPGAARRVQDPLSLRCVAQVHGAVAAALATAQDAVRAELNGASDNPAVLAETGEVVSHGGFFTPYLGVVLNALAQALVHLSAAQAARMVKLMMPRLTDLPEGFGVHGVESAGIFPATKSAEALAAEIVHLAQPMPVVASYSGSGVEDVSTHSAVPAKALLAIVDRLDRLTALELVIASQAVELRHLPTIAPAVAAAVARVRELVPAVTEDRSLGDEIEQLAAQVAARRVRSAGQVTGRVMARAIWVDRPTPPGCMRCMSARLSHISASSSPASATTGSLRGCRPTTARCSPIASCMAAHRCCWPRRLAALGGALHRPGALHLRRPGDQRQSSARSARRLGHGDGAAVPPRPVEPGLGHRAGRRCRASDLRRPADGGRAARADAQA